MDDAIDRWIDDLLLDNAVENPQFNAESNNSLVPGSDDVVLASAFISPQLLVAGPSGNDRPENGSRDQDEESLQDQIELLDNEIEGLDLQKWQIRSQRSLLSEQSLNDQAILSLLKQKNELERRRIILSMILRRQRRKLLHATGTTDGTMVVSWSLTVGSSQGIIMTGISISGHRLACRRLSTYHFSTLLSRP